jgi:hypothetical protein
VAVGLVGQPASLLCGKGKRRKGRRHDGKDSNKHYSRQLTTTTTHEVRPDERCTKVEKKSPRPNCEAEVEFDPVSNRTVSNEETANSVVEVGNLGDEWPVRLMGSYRP